MGRAFVSFTTARPPDVNTSTPRNRTPSAAAARSAGAPARRIVVRHVLPNAATPIIVLGTIQIAAIILLESSLSFLGFSGTTLSWGFDISRGRQYLATAWWIATEPGIAILLSVVSINLIGDWLRDALDPGIGGEGGV